MKSRIISELYNCKELEKSILKYANGNKHLAQDLKQELFLILLNKEENYFCTHEKNNSLLFSCQAIARNLAVNHYREQSKKINATCEDIEYESDASFLTAASNVLPDELKKVFHFDRKLLKLSLKGKSAKQIAEHYGINKDYVRRALHRGKLELGERIQVKLNNFEIIKYPINRKRSQYNALEIMDEIELNHAARALGLF